jgi:hypothetical protein
MIGLGYFGYKTSLEELSISTFFLGDKWISVFHLLRSFSTIYDSSGSSSPSYFSNLRRLSPIRIWASRAVQDQSQWFKYSITVHRPSISDLTRLHINQKGLGTLSQSSIHPTSLRQISVFYIFIASSKRKIISY